MVDPFKMTETELLQAILKQCSGRDLWAVVIKPERFNQRGAANKGFPDLMVFGPGGVIFRELKSEAGNGPGRGLAPAQSEWKHRVIASGQDWGLWTPGDLASGRIESELRDVETADDYTNEFSLAMARAAGSS